jgi:hypothetical protein
MPQEVSLLNSQRNIFYTYLWLRDDGSPYYVGKGKAYRAFEKKGHTCFPPQDKAKIKLQYWRDENTALAFEKYLIDFWGRKDLGTGCLRNRTDGGETRINLSEEGRQRVRESGLKAHNSGQLDIARTMRTKEGMARAGVAKGNLLKICKAGGLVTGKKNAESGRMREVQKTSNHIRWHINRDLISPTCVFCKKG